MARLLNNDLRERTVQKVIRDTFAEREAGLKRAVAAFAGLAYVKLVDPHFLAVVNNLPPEWFLRTDSIEITWTEPSKKGRSDMVHSLISPLHLLDESSRQEKYVFFMSGVAPFPSCSLKHFASSATLSLDGSEDEPVLRKIYDGMVETARAIVKEREAMQQQLRNLLASCRTVERFVEIAPELKSFIPPEAFAERAPMPAPIVGTLITDLMKCGLKVQEVEVSA